MSHEGLAQPNLRSGHLGSPLIPEYNVESVSSPHPPLGNEKKTNFTYSSPTAKAARGLLFGNSKEMAVLYVAIFTLILEDLFIITFHQIPKYFAPEVAHVLYLKSW